MQTISVVGAAAVWDYIFQVERLPRTGDIVRVLNDGVQPLPGGCAPNIAMGVARLSGESVSLCYPVGSEFRASGLQEMWEKAGVDCSMLCHVDTMRSGASWMYMQPDGNTMCFAYPGAANEATVAPGTVLGDWVVAAPVLNAYTAGLIELAVLQRRRLVLSGMYAPELITYLPSAYAVVINRHEAAILAEQLRLDGPEALSERFGGVIFYITNGKKGSAVFQGKRTAHIPLIPERTVRDYTGAGDAYTAGVVSALSRGVDPFDAGYVGSAQSSFAVEELGGQTGVRGWDEIKKRLQISEPAAATRIIRAWEEF